METHFEWQIMKTVYVTFIILDFSSIFSSFIVRIPLVRLPQSFIC